MPGAYIERWCGRRRGVWILSVRTLPRFLRGAPRRLTEAEVEALHARLAAAFDGPMGRSPTVPAQGDAGPSGREDASIN